MKINNVNILVSSKDSKVNSNTKLEYWSVGIMTLDDGSNFNITVKDKEIADVLNPMNKYEVNLSISNSQYGIRLMIDRILDHMGTILD